MIIAPAVMVPNTKRTNMLITQTQSGRDAFTRSLPY